MLNLLPRTPTEIGSGTIWIVIFIIVFYTAVIAVFMRHVGTVLKALLQEPDPTVKDILRRTLENLLEPFRRGQRR